MNKFFRSLVYIFTIAAVLLMSVMGPTTVYADDGTSTDPIAADPAPGEEPAAESNLDALPPLDPPLADNPESPPGDESFPEEVPPAESPVEVPEILAQVPEGTDLVVLNEDGTPESLASQEAADILIEGDPVWCPAGQVPTPGTNGCSASHAGFDDLLAELNGGSFSGAGVIWVESSYDATEDSSSIVFDGSSLTTLSDLSVQGGWDGVNGSSIVDFSNPSQLDDSMIFQNWVGNISVSNLYFNNALDANASLGIETDGNITLTDITITNNSSGSGAVIDNCLDNGSSCDADGDITVRDSEFSSNAGSGLRAESSGDMIVKDVTANSNTTDGLALDSDYGDANSVTVKNVTASNNSQDGLDIEDFAVDLTLTNITVDGNGSEGINIDDIGGNVTLKTITATGNDDGVEIDDTYGNVYGSNITATGNGSDGVDIDNTNGSVTISNSTASNNHDNGFEIDYADGEIKLYCVTASNNDGDGVNVDTNNNLTIKCSTITDNLEDGVDINLAPTAQLLSVTTTGNGSDDIEYDPLDTTLTIKEVDCNPAQKPKSSEEHKKSLYTKLFCLPGEIKVALYDTYGDRIEFNNLCGYEAAVFDPDSWVYPDAIPGGGEDYITSLQTKMLEEISGLEPITKYGLPGIIAQVLDELPFMLPDGFSYASAFFTPVLDDGEYLDPLPEGAGLTILFRVPDGLDPDESLTILWWNGLDWIDLGGEYSEDGYYFQVTTEEIGVFVLAIEEIEL